MYILWEYNSPELRIENDETELVCVSNDLNKMVNYANERIKSYNNEDFQALGNRRYFEMLNGDKSKEALVPQYVEMYKNGDENSSLWFEMWITEIEEL